MSKENSRWLHDVLHAAWALLLLVPNATFAARANGWDPSYWQPLAVSLWFLAAAWMLLPHRLMLLATYPVALAGVAVVAADRLRSADVLELLSVAFTFHRDEVVHELAGYVLPAALAGSVLLLVLVALWRRPAKSQRRPLAQGAVAMAGAALFLVVPRAAWEASWPANLVLALVEGQTQDTGVRVNPDWERASPRDRFATWGAHRTISPDQRETYVLVIGESVRADRIPGCGGRPQVSPPPADALLFCDVLSGAGATHASVPLLLSRGLPGARERVPHDGTVAKAFEAVGFETFWFSVQERLIAWPDARSQALAPVGARDRTALLPLLDQALARPEPRKFIVLHAYNAHSPYGERYDPQRAPFKVDRSRMPGPRPTRGALDQWWNDYDNAIDESMRFLQEVVARVQREPGEAFLLFTPDHAENMLDDARNLTDHALKRPTLWDTHVPLVAWSNAAWRSAHAARWQQLAANRTAPLMHMDVVPTLLGAAGIAYQEPRTLPVDLTARAVPPRARFAHLRAGQVVTLDALRQEAQDATDPR